MSKVEARKFMIPVEYTVRKEMPILARDLDEALVMADDLEPTEASYVTGTFRVDTQAAKVMVENQYPRDNNVLYIGWIKPTDKNGFYELMRRVSSEITFREVKDQVRFEFFGDMYKYCEDGDNRFKSTFLEIQQFVPDGEVAIIDARCYNKSHDTRNIVWFITSHKILRKIVRRRISGLHEEIINVDSDGYLIESTLTPVSYKHMESLPFDPQ